MSRDFGTQIRDRRRTLGLTQQDLSELAGVSVRFLRDLESGKPTVRMDATLAALDALGLEMKLVLRTPAALAAAE